MDAGIKGKKMDDSMFLDDDDLDLLKVLVMSYDRLTDEERKQMLLVIWGHYWDRKKKEKEKAIQREERKGVTKDD